MSLQLIVLCLLIYLDHSTGQSYDVLKKPYINEGPTAKDPKTSRADWATFTVKLDHHNLFDTRTFKLNYLTDKYYFKKGGPIFIFLGGTTEISQYYLNSGQMHDMAYEHNGHMFILEHRYYGYSHATGDYSTKNLQFLTTDQVLEDVAEFIAFQKSQEKFKDSKVVLVGCSYSASIATWMRLKYPHLVDAVYSSGARLLAKADNYEYLEDVSNAINQTDAKCLNVIKSGIQEILNLLETHEGRRYIIGLFWLCDYDSDLTKTMERSYFFAYIIWTWCGIVSSTTGGAIQKYCNVIHAASGTSTKKLAAFVRRHFSRCLYSYADHVKLHTATALSDDQYRRKMYQSCTQFGHFYTTSSDKQAFGNTIPLEFYHQCCLDFFGSNFTSDIINEGVSRTNLLFGQRKPEITKVVSVYGTMDPSHRLGVLSDINDHAPAIVVTGALRCEDLLSADKNKDSKQLYATKIRVKQLIAKWLGKNATTLHAKGDGSSMMLEFGLVSLFAVLQVTFIIK